MWESLGSCEGGDYCWKIPGEEETAKVGDGNGAETGASCHCHRCHLLRGGRDTF